jgi:hypothetical protein
MALEDEISKARKEIHSDGYDMSIGELINLYRDNELIIQPEFQRLFRWEDHHKTRFIESLLLGIPIPPIFVYQDENGRWELIDGLQRLSPYDTWRPLPCSRWLMITRMGTCSQPDAVRVTMAGDL